MWCFSFITVINQNEVVGQLKIVWAEVNRDSHFWPARGSRHNREETKLGQFSLVVVEDRKNAPILILELVVVSVDYFECNHMTLSIFHQVM